MLETLEKMVQGGLPTWMLVPLVGAGLFAASFTSYFKARKIQPNGFKWTTFRNEFGFAALNLSVTAFTLGPINGWLRSAGLITFNTGAASWWVIAAEYALYFFLFDTWFYWFHRLMHKEPFYTWVHKIHHKSNSPNLLTTVSESPLESLVNGGMLPVFLCVFTLHEATMVFIAPTAIFMGLYVHSGYEFLPRWWNKSWATKWFITTTFHDQHHKYFNYNFGGYTPIWDYICGTVRKKYEADFENPKSRQVKAAKPAPRNPIPAVLQPAPELSLN